MPSTKPQILIRTEQELIDKLDIIAKSQNRSRGNLAETVLKEYVNNYELNQESIKLGGTSKSNTEKKGRREKLYRLKAELDKKSRENIADLK
jgi:predicted transcriptional regulator